MTTKKQTIQIMAAREAGRVRRCHVLPGAGYDIAQHSYGALSLLLVLHPDPSVGLIKATLWHDIGERWLGDMPQTAKMDDSELTAVYEAAERRLAQRLDMFPDLDPDEQRWLRAVDVLDFFMFCAEQAWLGDRNLEEIGTEVGRVLDKMATDRKLPIEVVRFLVGLYEFGRARLPNLFSQVARDLDAAEAP